MSCPFLREGRARYCHAAPVRKLILDGPGATDGGRCASTRYVDCVLALKSESPRERCPHLEEIRVQYCGVSPIPKLVPFSDSELSSCTSNTYRYCDSYLHLAQPHVSTPASSLLYSQNHFWLDAEDSGLCHIGIDAFVAEIAGTVDGITFVSSRGTHCPAVALKVHGVEWPMNFPNPVMVQKVNGRLRSDPARLTADPYGAGWLFEGWEVPGRTRAGCWAPWERAAESCVIRSTQICAATQVLTYRMRARCSSIPRCRGTSCRKLMPKYSGSPPGVPRPRRQTGCFPPQVFSRS
jgi:glycine cleavage system H lipoate-binding protein